MKLSIGSLLRKLAVEFALTQDLKKLVGDADKTYGRANILKEDRSTLEKIRTDFSTVVKDRIGHGLSQAKGDEILGEIDRITTIKKLLAYASNLMLAGIGDPGKGMKVIRDEE
jgi:hypothetical protein